MIARTDSQRSKDQLALWILLSKLKEFGFTTQRLKLQKMVYLADVFGVMVKEKPTNYVFRVHNYGPFSKEIVNDIECLVSRDAVKAKNVNGWNPNQERSFEYEISVNQLNKIRFIQNLPEFLYLNKFMEFIVQAVGYLNGTQIKTLVYSEPNYLDAKRKGFGTEINPEYSFALRYKQISRKLSSETFGIELRDEEILWLYLNYLREVSKQNKTRPIETEGKPLID